MRWPAATSASPSATPATSSRRATAPPRPRTSRTSPTPSRSEGSLLWIDVAAIPKDAPNPDNALRFLDFMLEPKVAAASSELTGYANANMPATALLPKDISGNPLIYPPADVRAKLLHHHRRQRRADARAHAAVDHDEDGPMT